VQATGAESKVNCSSLRMDFLQVSCSFGFVVFLHHRCKQSRNLVCNEKFRHHAGTFVQGLPSLHRALTLRFSQHTSAC
jgi:hypothetical protein